MAEREAAEKRAFYLVKHQVQTEVTEMERIAFFLKNKGYLTTFSFLLYK